MKRLTLLYKANPWIVIQFKNRWSERREYRHEGISWAYGEIRGGTAPVQVGDLFFTFHHSSLPWKGRYRRYYAGCLAFDAKPPFHPKLITHEPLLQGSQNDVWAQRKPLVVFPCGALYFPHHKGRTDINGKEYDVMQEGSGHWLVSMGVNDLKSAWLELSHESLLSRMKPVEDVTGQIFQSTIPNLGVGDGVNTSDKGGSGTEQPSAVCSPELEAGESLSVTKRDQLATNTQTTLEKRRAALVKARAARAAKRVFHLPEDTEKLVESKGTNGETESGGRWFVKTKKRRRRRKRVSAQAKLKAADDYKKSLATEEVKE